MGGDPGHTQGRHTPGSVVGRDHELQAMRALLDAGRRGPAALILDGEAGIGKTTLTWAVVDAATAAGFRVLTTSGAAAEVSLAWAALADLIDGIDADVLAELAPLHQQAVQAITTGAEGLGGDERLVAMGLRTALERQSQRRPLLVVVDDAQWIDEPSKLALGFAVRRLSGPAVVLAAFRSGEPGGRDRSWVQPRDPSRLNRLTLGPMPDRDLRAVLTTRLGRRPSPAAMAHIESLAGGNPLYALELGRSLDDKPDNGAAELPVTLSELVRRRIGELDAATAEAMLTVATAFEPTVEVIAAATNRSPDDLVVLLEPLERRGVLIFDGARIRLTHPLIASGITADADPTRQRCAHRRLAAAVSHPEQRARHLALSTAHGDPETLAALDAAAENAAARGAYSTAAELVSLAIRLGADDQLQRLRGGDYFFRAGDFDGADAMVAPILEDLPAGFMRTVGLLLLSAVRGYRDGVTSTIGMLQRAVEEAGDNLVLRTQALLVLALSTGIGGDLATCVEQAARARADADATGLPALRSQALTLSAHVNFLYGLGTDTAALDEALKLGEPDPTTPIMLRPKSIHALQCGWTGRLEQGLAELTEVWNQCAERGNELEMLWADEQLTTIEVGLGRYDDAARTAAGALERAEHLGGRLPLITAHTAIAHAAAYQGRIEDARVSAGLAIAGATEAGLGYLVGPPTMSLAFALVSDGHYEEALQALQPLMASFDPQHDTEIVAGAFLPDAVEALTALGRVAEAEPLVAALETNGARLDRPWMLAVGARGRAQVQAAMGDLDSALKSTERALGHHERLPMPFERARTLLLAGQLQRRRRRTHPGRAMLTEAVAVFEELGSPLWAQRARRELTRLEKRAAGTALTEAERQVAKHATEGMTNNQIAALLYVSAKTVEMHLSSAYRKLGIRSRTQLIERLRAGELRE